MFVERACGDDAAAKGEVLAMLEQDNSEGTIIDRGLPGMAVRFTGASRESMALEDFAPYRIKRPLGEGGMGAVYLAEHKNTGKLVAIKVLLDARWSPARRERFDAEQKILAKLDNRYIAQLYHADVLANGTPWFAMEYVEGQPIDDYCREQECSMERRLRLFRALCEAVKCVHAQTFVHRDLKPSNVLVTGDGTPKLLDFGIGKSIENLSAEVRRTAPGLRMMTIAYAAPEQLRGLPAVFNTDVYALGVILYELAAGCHPFDLSKCTTAEAERIVAEQDPVRPSEMARRNAGAPRATKAEWNDLDALILKAMHKEAGRRYQSVEALLRDLDHYLAGEPLEARPDSLPYKTGKFVRRNRRAVLAGSVALAMIIGVVAFYTIRLAKARDAALAEAARTERVERFMLNLIKGGDEEAGPSEDLRVVTLLDRGVKEVQALNRDPAIQADLYQTLASVYQSFGKFDRAEPLLNSAMAIRKAAFGPDCPEVADGLFHLSALRYDQGRWAEAESLVREALAMNRRHLPPDHPAIARTIAALGRVLKERGSYREAIEVLQEAVRLQSAKGGASADLTASLNLLADANFYLGNYAASDSLNRQVLTIDRQLHGDRHPDIADALVNLGNVQINLERYAEAERYFRQALEIDRSWYGREHPNSADIETYVGQALAYEKRPGEAEVLLRHALAVFERTYGSKPDERVAMAYGQLGRVAQTLGNFDDAEDDFRKSADAYAAVYGGNHAFVAVELSNLASVYRDTKQFAKAELALRKAVQCLTAALPADHLDIGVARVKLGDILAGEKRYREAEGQLIAGYEILKKQSPAASTLRAAGEDLVAVYVALKMPEKAAHFRAGLAGSGPRNGRKAAD
jgi:serine/threonine-protein kinase